MQTLDSQEPSLAIATNFLDMSNIDQLVQYLERLHQQQNVNKHYTALLLNCYIKLRQFDNFKEKKEKYGFDSELFDIETAIKECRQSGYLDIALDMATKKSIYSACLQIYILDKGECAAALEYIRNVIPLAEKANFLKEFGSDLMKVEPEFTSQVIMNLVLLINIIHNQKKNSDSRKGLESIDRLTPEQITIWKYFNPDSQQLATIFTITFCKPDEFLHIFSGYDKYQERYLRFLIEECKNLPNEMAIFHRYVGYHLERFERKEDVVQSENSIMKLLLEDQNESKYDKNHLLVQFKLYKFQAGIIFLLKKLQMREELLNFYITHKENDEIIKLCSEYGEQEQNLWIQALKYFAKPDNKATQNIPIVLQEIIRLNSVSPFMILDIMKENSNIKYGEIKSYLIEQLTSDKKEIAENITIIKENMAKAGEVKSEYKRLKTQAQTFSFIKCAACSKQLTLPSFHFICGHQYHELCIHIEEDKRVCVKCSDETKVLLDRQKSVQLLDDSMFRLKDVMLQQTKKIEIFGKYK